MLKAAPFLVLFAAAPALAHQTRVGVVDFNKIYTQTATAKRDRAELDKLMAAKQAEVDAKRAKVSRMQADLEQARPRLDAVDRARRENEVDAERGALKQLFEAANKQVSARERELSGRVLADAKTLAPEVARQHGLDLVLGAAEALLWSAPSVAQVDLTDEVAHALDRLHTRQSSVLQRRSATP
jgi:outer membrane protein